MAKRTAIEGKECPIIGNLLYKLYGKSNKFGKGIILNLIWKTEGNGFYQSITIRRIFSKYHNVEIGMYSHGGCFTPGNIGEYTTIGRFCSFANPFFTTNNHPIDWKTTHAFAFNPAMGMTDEKLVSFNHLKIGNDVWCGMQSIILPSVKEICDGAIVAAGAVVHKDVPPYAIVVGNPARVVRFRFSPKTISALLEERWWNNSMENIQQNIKDYQTPLI